MITKENMYNIGATGMYIHDWYKNLQHIIEIPKEVAIQWATTIMESLNSECKNEIEHGIWFNKRFIIVSINMGVIPYVIAIYNHDGKFYLYKITTDLH